MKVYLDNGATTKPDREVVSRMSELFSTGFGNPSSLHSEGRTAAKLLKEAREDVASCLGVLPEEIYFNSGGTEGDNTVIFGVWEKEKRRGNRIITTEGEHPAVLESCRRLEKDGADVVYVPLKADGSPDLEFFSRALNEETILVSVMHANNETGTVSPLGEISDSIKRVSERSGRRIFFHTDAVQSFCKVPLSPADAGLDFITVSAHKFHGPKGTGAMYIRKGVEIPPFIFGGGQEASARSGTENVPCIAGLALAAKIYCRDMEKNSAYVSKLKNHLKYRIIESIPDVKINGDGEVSPYILNISLPGCRGEVLMRMLDDAGIAVSTGSACSSKSKGSHVLRAMGLLPDELDGALRFSFCPGNTIEEMDYVSVMLIDFVERQRRISGYRPRDRYEHRGYVY